MVLLGILLFATLLGATPARAQPDLTLTKGHTGNFVAGMNGAYDLTVENVGLAATLGPTTVVDSLPPGLTFVSGSGFGWAFGVSGQEVTATRASFFAPGDTSSFRITVAVDNAAAPSVTNRAWVSTFGDANASNDSATDFTLVNVVDLAIDKSHTGDFTAISVDTYTLRVTNIGSAASFGTITVLDTLPAGLLFVSGTGTGWNCNATGQIVTCDRAAPLATGASTDITLTVAVDHAAVPSVTNRAHVSTAGDDDPSNDSDADPTVVNGRPDLTIDKEHAGDFIVFTDETYDLVVENVGSAATSSVTTVVDTLPEGLTFVSGEGMGWSVSAVDSIVTATHAGPIAVSDTTLFTITVNVGPAAAPSVTNSAVVSNPDDPNPSNDRDVETNTVVAGGDLSINKSHTGIFTVGVDGTYTIAVANVGSSPSVGTITVTDVLPDGLTYVDATGPGWSCSNVGQTVSCNYSASIAPGDSARITLVVGVGPSAVPSVTNTATLTNAVDPDPSNNADADPTIVTPVHLTLAKSHVGDFTVGTNGDYTLTVENVGIAATSTPITVRDTLPSGLGFVAGSGIGWAVSATGQVVTATRASPLGAGASSDITLTVSAGAAAYPSTVNRAVLESSDDGTPADNVASDSTTVLGVDLDLDKSHTGDFMVGTPGVYDFALTNLGTTNTFGGVTVRDTLPNGLTFSSGSGVDWSFNASGQVVTGTYSGPPLAPGDTTRFSIIVSVGSSAVPSVTNRAWASTIGEGDPSNDGASDPTTVIGEPDLTISKTHAADFSVGSNGTYDLSVTNVGSGATSGTITVTDTLPAGLSYVSGTGAGWSIGASGQVVTATHPGPLASGANLDFSLTVSVSPAAAPGVVNRAHVSVAGDPDNSNDTASDPTTVTILDLGIDKSHNASFTVGFDDLYEILVTNVGTESTTGAITVTDTLPAGLSYVAAAGPGWSFGVAGAIVTASRPGPMAPGDTASFAITVAVDSAAAPSVTNTAWVSTPGDQIPANDGDSDPTVVNLAPVPDLGLTKSHVGDFTADTTGVYTLVVRNWGQAATTDVITVRDTLPAGLTFVSGSGAGWTFGVSGSVVTAVHLGPFAPGDTSSITLTVAVDSSAVPGVTNVAVVSTSGDPDPSNDRALDPTMVNPPPAPDLALAKSHSGDFTVGVNGLYTLVVSNVGTAATSGPITVRDTLPPGLRFVSGAGPGWSFSASGQVVSALHLGPFAPGDTSSFALTVAVDSSAAPGVTNVAEVSTSGDADPANDRAEDPTVVNGPPAPDLSLAKSHTGDFTAGVNGLYRLLVTNLGSASTSGPITVRDTLPAGLAYVSAAGAGWSFSVSGPFVTALHLGPLAPGDTASFDLTVAVDTTAIPSVTNVAQVSTPGDPNLANDRAVDPTTVLAPGVVAQSNGELFLTKSASRAAAEIGDIVGYTLRISNVGTDPVVNVDLHDDLPAGFSILTGSVRLDGAAAPDPPSRAAQVTIPIGGVPVGDTRVLTYRVRVGPTAPLGDGVNTALAESVTDSVISNPATAVVRIVGGAFSDDGVIFGKVHVQTDCYDDRVQGKEEPGIPGVRVYLEDGTSATTDSEGKYHFFGVRPRTHVVRVDQGTLPPGARLVVLDHRQAGDAASRFVDLKRGELHQADFAEGSGADSVLRAVFERRMNGEIDAPAPSPVETAEPGRPRVVLLGLVEGRIDFRSRTLSGLQPVRQHDRFEEELRDVSVTTSDGKTTAGTRAALFLKGKVKGEYLLTLALDTEEKERERLFRDIQPDEFYPIYGDASVKEYDAQSAGELYVRVERNESYLLYGDFQPSQGDGPRALNAYQRSLTGLRHHLDTGPVLLDSFLSRARSRQVVDEITGRGVSGPYQLSRTDVRPNSETVEILVRDRNQPSRVLSVRAMARFVDYAFDPLTGRLVFRAPVPSVDDELNPVSIQVTYELVAGGNEFLVYGLDGALRAGSTLSLGGSATWDEDPTHPWQLYGADATLSLNATTRLTLEVARSDSAESVRGNAGRAELRHAGSRLDASIHAASTDEDFVNPSTNWATGRDEFGLETRLGIGPHTNLRGEVLRTQDRATGGRRDGAEATLEHWFADRLGAAVGFRHGEESTVPADSQTVSTTPNEFDAVLGRLTLPVPFTKASRFFAEHEQDVDRSEISRTYLGLDHPFWSGGRLYARQEWIGSFAGPYALDEERRLSTTVVGLTAEGAGGARAFSEYRIRDGISGREGAAAIGLRNRWKLSDGLRLDTSFERVNPIRGDGAREATAVTAGLEILADPRSRVTLRSEFRTSPAGDDWLASAGFARKLNRDLSVLGRGIWNQLGTLDRSHARGRFGFAYRQTEASTWNTLGRYEYRLDRDNSLPAGVLEHEAHVVVGDLHLRSGRRVRFTGHAATKWADDTTEDLTLSTRSHWFGVRTLVDVSKDWDVGLLASVLYSGEPTTRREGLGAELGRVFARNLRVAAGYNFFGFRDDDLTGENYTDHGVYLNVGFKFDESLLGLSSAGGFETPEEE